MEKLLVGLAVIGACYGWHWWKGKRRERAEGEPRKVAEDKLCSGYYIPYRVNYISS